MSDAHHTHTHAHPTEDYAARTHPEFVVLELGERLGALILHTDRDMHGVEVEISPDGDPHDRSHKQVLERSLGGRAAFTAVFDALAAGSYTLWVDGQPRARGVGIQGGLVAELDWTSS
jgi:hypothetical protein